jgi:hypothetical protein
MGMLLLEEAKNVYVGEEYEEKGLYGKYLIA